MLAVLQRCQRFADRYWSSFSFVGLVFATLFFAISVSPSLLPRVWVVQGVLSGFALAIGYGVGNGLAWLWSWLELPSPAGDALKWTKRITTTLVALIVAFFVWKSTEWQNSIRQLMEMPELKSSEPFQFLLVAIIVAVVLVAIVRTFIYLGGRINQWLQRFLPRRIAIMVSSLLVGFLVLFISNDLVAQSLLSLADRAFQRIDGLIDDDVEQPQERGFCGSPDSLIAWDTIGRQGKNFIAHGPSADAIKELTGREAKQPIRVYAGMNSGETVEQRAELALEELQRLGGFDRKILVVATPTGTGWLDEGAVDTIEYLHGGDTAIVSTQYSYLPSWITILVEPNGSRLAGKALFNAIYRHWKSLDKSSRPQLYLFGLSLGSLGCEEAADLLDTFEDPIQGAVWSGPPFPSPQWNNVVKSRNEGTPIWMPTYRDSSMIRFTAQLNHLESDKRWGPIRNVYIQYASDPMVWFSPDLLWQRPAWLDGDRGPDVSPALSWYPVVTFLQVAFDLPLATSVPIGYGHNYSGSSYIDAWLEVTQPADWTAEETTKLKSKMRERELALLAE